MRARDGSVRLWSVFSIAAVAFVLAALIGGNLVVEPGFAGPKGVIPALAPVGSAPGTAELPPSGTFAPLVKKTAPAVGIRIGRDHRRRRLYRDKPPRYRRRR